MKKHRPQRLYAAGCVLGAVLLGLAIVWALHTDSPLHTLFLDAAQPSFCSAVLLLLLYGLKSATVFFPLLILEMTAGYL